LLRRRFGSLEHSCWNTTVKQASPRARALGCSNWSRGHHLRHISHAKCNGVSRIELCQCTGLLDLQTSSSGRLPQLSLPSHGRFLPRLGPPAKVARSFFPEHVAYGCYESIRSSIPTPIHSRHIVSRAAMITGPRKRQTIRTIQFRREFQLAPAGRVTAQCRQSVPVECNCCGQQYHCAETKEGRSRKRRAAFDRQYESSRRERDPGTPSPASLSARRTAADVALLSGT
jgi:hypothetical protein